MLEYPQLTRAIYFTARAGRVIPEELFVAVATVLAFVFQLERAVADGIVQPAVDVPPTHRFDPEDRKSVVSGKSVSVRVALGGRRVIKKNKKITQQFTTNTTHFK